MTFGSLEWKWPWLLICLFVAFNYYRGIFCSLSLSSTVIPRYLTLSRIVISAPFRFRAGVTGLTSWVKNIISCVLVGFNKRFKSPHCLEILFNTHRLSLHVDRGVPPFHCECVEHRDPHCTWHTSATKAPRHSTRLFYSLSNLLRPRLCTRYKLDCPRAVVEPHSMHTGH